jgi:transglutaminase-like putative cysteine protease
LLRTIVPVKGKSALQHRFDGKAEYEATLIGRKLVKREPDVKYAPPDVLTPQSREYNLRSSPMYDFEEETFTDWLEEEELYRRKNESELHFARRAFLTIKSEFEYDYQAEMNRCCSNVCEAGKSDCGGLSVLFASVMRANKIPARALAGCWAKSSKPDAKLNGVRYSQVHIKAEVYITDIGWIPIDMSSAINHDKTPEGLHYFGNDPGDFLTMHVECTSTRNSRSTRPASAKKPSTGCSSTTTTCSAKAS